MGGAPPVKYLKREEAAAYLNVTKHTLNLLLRWGHLPETREGIPLSSLERYWATPASDEEVW